MAIGRVSVQALSAPTPYIRETASALFTGGAGLSSALTNLSNKLEVNAEKLRLEDERARKQSEAFSARTRWTEEQGEWARTQIDYVNNAPADGSGMTDARHAELVKRRDAFVSTLPADLQEEYISITEGTLQDYATNTYAKEYELRFTYQTDALVKTAGSLAGEIRAGRTTMESALAEFDEVLSTSGLPEATKQDMRDKASTDLAGAQFAQITQEALTKPQAVRDPAAGDVVAGGLSPGQRGMLNAIAKRESNGKYNIRYTLSGGTEFTGYADHPRIFEPTKDGQLSSAAGRYQFTASTWDDLVNRYGRETLPDFSPASQDRAALLLARERYHANKGADERSFDDILVNGSDAELGRLKSILGGSGNRTTWHAFQSMSDAEFISLFRGEEGVAGGGTGSAQVPDVWTDPRFAGLDYDTKSKLAGQAEEAANAIRAEGKAQQQAVADMLKANIAAGTAGEKEVNEAITSGAVASTEFDTLLNLVKDERESRKAAESFAANADAGLLTENSPENQKSAMKYLQLSGVFSGLQEQSPQASAQLSHLFGKSGVLPKEVSGLLETMSRSQDPRQVSYAMDTLTTLRAKNPDLFAAAVSKETSELEGVWQMARKYSPNGDTAAAMDMLKNFRDPAQAQVRETMRKEAQKQLTEITDEQIEDAFDPGIFSTGPALPISPQARGVLRSDFNKLYETYYPMFGDSEQTTEFVAGQMRHNWGVDDSGGTARLMYLAPTSGVSGYRPIEGSYDWIREDILTSQGWDDNVEFELFSDGQTEAEAKGWKDSGQPASYLIIRRDDTGQFRMETDSAGMPKRFVFTPSQYILDDRRDRTIERNLEEKLSRAQQENSSTPTPSFGGFGALPGKSDTAEIASLRAQLEELRSGRELRKKEQIGNTAVDTMPLSTYNMNGVTE